MGLRVIGTGLGRTGTNSLKLALEELLGGPCYHMFEVRGAEAHGAVFVSPVSTDSPAPCRSQTKTKILDPSGNVIEIKTYVDSTDKEARRALRRARDVAFRLRTSL